jgi:hypothetical protein
MDVVLWERYLIEYCVGRLFALLSVDKNIVIDIRVVLTEDSLNCLLKERGAGCGCYYRDAHGWYLLAGVEGISVQSWGVVQAIVAIPTSETPTGAKLLEAH